MAKLNFQGASGYQRFTEQHDLFATVNNFQVNGGKEKLIGSHTVPQVDSEMSED